MFLTLADVNLESYYKNMALVEAVCGGRLDMVKCMVRSGAVVNDNCGLAMYETVAKGNVDILNHLTAPGADVNRTYPNGKTALVVAVLHGNEEIVNYLVQTGADVNIPNPEGQTPLMLGARGGYVNVVQTLLDAGAGVNKLDNRGNTALVLAAQEGHVSVAKILINSRVDVNVVCGTTYRNALYEFAVRNNVNGVRLLLRSGANVNTDKSFIRSTISTTTLNNNVRELLFAAGQKMGPRKGAEKMCENCT